MKVSQKYKGYLGSIVESHVAERSRLSELLSHLLRENKELKRLLDEKEFEIRLLSRKIQN